MKIQRIPLNQISPNADNPNPHSDEKVTTLSANIAEFGLIHPITVKAAKHNANGQANEYEIIAGEGRYQAYRKLWKDAKNQKQTDGWTSIPCVVVGDTSDYKDWGRRLSENKLRSFNWVAECVELARMRDHGKSAKELAGLFGYEEKYLTKVAALGFIPGLSKLAGCPQGTQNSDSIISNIDARDHLLPLRVWPASMPKNDKSLDYSLYDYTECVTAIDLLASGELSPSDLPSYSAERREAIARAQEQERIKLVAAQELANIKAELTEKDKAVKKAESDKAKAVKEAQTKATAEIEKARKETESRIQENSKKLQAALADLENAGSDKAELQSMIHHLEEEKGDLERRLQDQATDMERMREQIQAEIEERIRVEVIDRLKKEIQAEKDEEAELEIKEGMRISAEEKTANDKEKARLKKYHENLMKREQELKDELARFQEQRDKQAQLYDLSGWIKEFNRRGEEFLEILEIANSNQYWTLMQKPEFKRIFSVCSGVGDELRKVSTFFSDRGFLGGK